MFGLLVLLGIADGFKHHDWEAFWISFTVLFGFLLWVASFRLMVDDRKLIYRSLFSGTRSIALSDVKTAKVEYGVKDSFGPFHRLTIYPLAKSELRPIVINLKVFSREDIKQLSHIFAGKLK